jgi:hypothetical protein
MYNCFWTLPEQSLLGPSPAELTAIFYCLICDSPNLEGQVPVFISRRNRITQLYPRALGLTQSQSQIQSQSYITTDSQSASLSWCQAPIWDRQPIFPILSLIIFLDSFEFH